MDIASILGIALALTGILGGMMMEGGSIAQIAQPTAACIVLCGTTGAVLLRMGYAKVPPQAHLVFWTSLALWAGSYGLAGWINSGGEPNRERLAPVPLDRREYASRLGWGYAWTRNTLRATRVSFWCNRVFQTVCAIILTPFTALSPIVIIIISVLSGRPKRFEMIAKSNAAMNRSGSSPVGR